MKTWYFLGMMDKSARTVRVEVRSASDDARPNRYTLPVGNGARHTGHVAW